MTYKLKSLFFFVFFLCSIALYYAIEEQQPTISEKAENTEETIQLDARI